MSSASELDPVFTKQQRIAELAKQSPQLGFTSLAHHIDLRWLHEAFLRTRSDGAAGVDGQTAADYTANLRDNLQALLERARSGTYRAPPVRRVYIPKGTGPETRPIGIPTLEDKILQRGSSWCSKQFTSRTFVRARMAFGPDGRHTRRWTLSGSKRWGCAVVGLWKWTSASSSTRWITLTCGTCFGSGYATGCCCD